MKHLRRGVWIGLTLITGGLVVWGVWRMATPPDPAQHTRQLYERDCAACHGVRGDGRGEAAYLLQPKPRNFRAGRFRLVSSEELQPTREDLFRVITRGMPGTAMPPWGHLDEADRWALAEYVLHLSREGWLQLAMSRGETREEAEKYAQEMTRPGKPIPIPPEPAVTPEGLEVGRQYYLEACARCHGDEGEGYRDPHWRTHEGYPTWARNLKRGVFKGGREGEQLYLRFFTGLPGTPMPSGFLEPDQVWRVVQFIQSLSDPEDQERATPRVLEIKARRVAEIPPGPGHPGWQEVPAQEVVLMPLWWREETVEEVRVRVVHDGRHIVFHLEWEDPTRDAGGVRTDGFSDASAVQMTADPSPPLFAMGAPGKTVHIWHWRALWDEDLKAFRDVESVFPAMAADGYFGASAGWEAGPLDDPVFIPARELDNPVARPRETSTEKAVADGFGTYTALPPGGQDLEASSEWRDGVWRLTLRRALDAAVRGEVALRPPQTLSVAFAVWDGSAGDLNGQKSVSIWNTLLVEE